jgi:Concanavalin A-like lectin/glucanases superfamily
MARILSRTRKPKVDEIALLKGRWREHARYQGCLHHWLFHEGGGINVYDIAGGNNHGTLFGTGSENWINREQGVCVTFDGSTEYVALDKSYALPGPFTCHVWIQFLSFTAAIVSSVVGQSTVDQNRLTLTYTGAPVTTFSFLFRPTTTNVTIVSGLPISLLDISKMHLLTWRRNAANQMHAFVDGINRTTTPLTNADSFDPGQGGTATPYLMRSTANECEGIASEIRIYDRAQTDTEIASMFLQPYTEFTETAQRRPRLWYPPAAPGNVYTLDVTQGAAASTGQSVELEASRILSVSLGVANATGQSVALQRAGVVTVSHAPIVATGQSVETEAGRLIAVSPSTASGTGQSLSVSVGRRIDVSAALALATGRLVVLSSESTLDVVSRPAFALGRAVELEATRMLGVLAGAATAAGQTVTLSTGATLDALPAMVGATGQGVELGVTRTLDVSPAIGAGAGQTVTLSTGLGLDVNHGAATGAGQTVSLIAPRTLDVIEKTEVAAGESVGLVVERAIFVSRALASCTRESVILERGSILAVGANIALASGQDVEIVYTETEQGYTLDVSPGLAVATGEQLTVSTLRHVLVAHASAVAVPFDIQMGMAWTLLVSHGAGIASSPIVEMVAARLLDVSYRAVPASGQAVDIESIVKVILPTPPGRVFVIEPEPRYFVVEEVNRAFVVERVGRIFIVGKQSRWASISEEKRFVVIK